MKIGSECKLNFSMALYPAAVLFIWPLYLYYKYWVMLQEAELKMATQLSGEVMPIVPFIKADKAQPITDDMKKYSAFTAIRQARANKRLYGIRKKKAEEAEEAKK